MLIANLGCGTKTSSDHRVVNIDKSIYHVLKKHKYLLLIAKSLFNDFRFQLIDKMPDNIVVHDLSKGIPFDNDSVDVVYHSHVLEHIDRDKVKLFLNEVKRVLRPGGVHRIVVPDFETLCREYINHVDACDNSPQKIINHEDYIAAIIEQSVRKESAISKKQKPFKRLIENILLGDARKRGETHQWMYDRITLKKILVSLGYQDVKIQSFNTSCIHDWNKIGLDLDEQGNPCKPGSLCIEAIKPGLKA